MPIVIHNHWIDKLAVLTGAVSGFALYPQIFIIITSGSTESVSLTTYAIILLNSIVWLMYSIHRGLISLAIPSILNIFASVVVIVWFFAV
ncbi:MAG TPA: PQ-loop domain-containing transporter [Candidatus Paceibacterota bacterium]